MQANHYVADILAGTTGTRKLNISWPCAEFTKLVKSWDKYDEATMGITIKYIKRYFDVTFEIFCILVY
jgi:poly(A) polymerase Pap1